MTGNIKRRIEGLRKKAELIPETPLDFSEVPSDILYKIANEEYSDDELVQILETYNVVKSDT